MKYDKWFDQIRKVNSIRFDDLILDFNQNRDLNSSQFNLNCISMLSNSININAGAGFQMN